MEYPYYPIEKYQSQPIDLQYTHNDSIKSKPQVSKEVKTLKQTGDEQQLNVDEIKK